MINQLHWTTPEHFLYNMYMMKNKKTCTNCKKEFDFTNEYDKSFQTDKVFKYPRTPRRQFCGHICSIRYMKTHYRYDHFSARYDWS